MTKNLVWFDWYLFLFIFFIELPLYNKAMYMKDLYSEARQQQG